MMKHLLRFSWTKLCAAAALLVASAAHAQMPLTSFTVSAYAPPPSTSKTTVYFSAFLGTANSADAPGTVTFFFSNSDLCDSSAYTVDVATVDGEYAAYSTAGLPAGTFNVCATYTPAPDSAYAGQTTTAADNNVSQLTIYGAALTVTGPATAPPNTAVTFMATVTGTPAGGPAPTGTVTLYDNSTQITYGPTMITAGTPVPFTITGGESIGDHEYSVTYSGDNNYPVQTYEGDLFVPAGLIAIKPGGLASGQPDTAVTLIGTGFTGASIAQQLVNGTPVNLATTFVSATELQAVIPASALSAAGTLPLQVNTAGVTSNTFPLLVYTPFTAQVASSATPTTFTYGQTEEFGVNATITRGLTTDAAVPSSGPSGGVSYTLSSAGGTTVVQGTLPVTQAATPGSYQAGTQSAVDSVVFKVLAADFNGDGRMDVISSPLSELGYLQLFLAAAPSGFSGEIQVSTGCGVVDFAVADINQDGKPDVVVACNGYGSPDPYAVYVLGNGDGTFQPPVAIAGPANSTFSNPGNIAVGDFNGDGALDVALFDMSGNLQVFTGSAPFGTFTPRTVTQYPFTVGTTPLNVVAADFNQDGKSDLALLQYQYEGNINSNVGQVSILVSNGDGTFTTGTQQTFQSPSYGNAGLTVTDVNGDGFPDVVIADPGESGDEQDPGQLLIYENDGSGAVGAAGGMGATYTYVAAGAVAVTGAPFPVIGKPAAASLPAWNLFYATEDPDTQAISTAALQRQSATAYTQVFTNTGLGYATYEDSDFEPVPLIAADLNGDTYLDVALWGYPTPGQYANNITPLYYGNDAQADGAFLLQAPSSTIAQLVPGAYTLTAAYPGDLNYAGGSAPGIPFTVTQATPAVNVTGPGTSTVGQSVTFVSTVTGAAGAALPSGTVQFYYDNDIPLGAPQTLIPGTLASTTQLTTTALPAGMHQVMGIYQGDTNYFAATSYFSPITVSQAVPVITWPAPAAIAYGTPLSAQQLDATASVPGTFAYTPPAGAVLTPGSHTLSVLFTPTDAVDYTTATAMTTVHVLGAPSVTSLSVNPAALTTGEVVTLQSSTAPASGGAAIATGSTTFYDGKTALGTAENAGAHAATGFETGQALLKTRLGPGAHSLTAVFSGTATALPSTSPATPLTVTGTEPSSIALTAAANASTPANYDFTAVVSGFGHAPPAGTVNFLDQTTGLALGSAPVTMAAGDFNLVPAPAIGFSNAVSTAMVDLNNDGILDLAVEYYSPDYSQLSVTVSLGVGDGTFLPGTSYLLGGSDGNYLFNAIGVGDFNQDGIPDIIATDTTTDSFYVLIGKGDGTFANPVTYAGGMGGAQSIAVGDVNGDGIPDAVAPDNAGDNNVLLGNGDGTFQPPATTTSTGGGGDGILLGVFTQSGAMDAVITDTSLDELNFFAGHGDGTFSPATMITVGNNPSALTKGDWNGDGKLDLAVTNQSDGTVSVLLGKGDGTFQPQVVYPVGNDPISILTSDVNGDGIADLLVSNFVDGTISILLGNGDGTFAAQTTLPATGGILSTGDLNGDGVMDLVTAGPTVTVVLGGTSLTTTLSDIPIPGVGVHTVQAAFVPAADSIYNPSTKTVTVPASGAKLAPVITWANPAPIAYGTPLSAVQLDATATPAGGTFTYTPPAGTVLNAGTQTLSVLYTPVDTMDYATATASVTLIVTPAGTGPSLTSIAPTSGYLGAADTTLTLTGTAFQAESVATLNGSPLATTYVSATELQAVIPASFFTTIQTGSVTVTTPGEILSSASFTFSVVAPPVSVILSGPPTSPPATQPTINFQLPSAYPVAISGTFTLSVAPATAGGAVDPAVQFLTGGDTYTFTLPANTTTTPTVQLQTGTLTANITVTLTLMAGTANITPASLQPVVIQVPPAAPTITSMALARNGDNLTVTMQGFSNTREMKSALFTFTAAAGATINTPSLTVDLEPSFLTWYGQAASDQYGSAFTYVQTFALTGDATTIGSVSATLVNTAGNSNIKTAQ
jgi:hypothetical protein